MKLHRTTGTLVVAALFALLSLLSIGCSSFPECSGDDCCASYSDNQGRIFCVDDVCRECRDDSVCEMGEQCRNGSCERIPGWCPDPPDDSWCQEGQICDSNRCRAGCRDDSWCDDDQHCDMDTLTCEYECTMDRDCTEGFRCEEHYCVVDRACADREFETVFFDFDQSLIRRDQEQNLQENLLCFSEYPGDSVQLEGHCDERGTEAYNLALGERRARAAGRFLEGQGIDDDRLSTISYGESRPGRRGHDESAWRQNRRVEFVWR